MYTEDNEKYVSKDYSFTEQKQRSKSLYYYQSLPSKSPNFTLVKRNVHPLDYTVKKTRGVDITDITDDDSISYIKDARKERERSYEERDRKIKSILAEMNQKPKPWK